MLDYQDGATFALKTLLPTMHCEYICECPFMASGKDNGTLPKFAHPHAQRAQRKPCRIFAIYETTWQYYPCHMSFLNAARLHFYSHSCLTASPIV